MNQELLMWAVRSPQIVQELLTELGEEVGSLEDTGMPAELCSRLTTFHSYEDKLYSTMVFDSHTGMMHYFDDFPLEWRSETAIVAFSLWQETENFQEKRTTDDGRTIYIINLGGAVVPWDAPVAIRELALIYQGVHLEPETHLGELLLKTPAGAPHMNINRELVFKSQQDPKVAMKTFSALKEIAKQFALEGTEDEPRYKKALFRSFEGWQYSTMVFPSYFDRCIHLECVNGWAEKFVVAFSLNGGLGSFSGLCEKGQTKIRIINLDAVVPKTASLPIKEMAWLYQGGRFEPETDLGEAIINVQ